MNEYMNNECRGTTNIETKTAGLHIFNLLATSGKNKITTREPKAVGTSYIGLWTKIRNSRNTSRPEKK